MNCKNCNTEINSKFCPDCGQPTNLKRIDGHYVMHEIEHVLHFERGILYTVRELITKPGQNIRNYLSENRSRLVKPVIFIIVTSLIYTIISHFFLSKKKL
jgi:predicted regulator of amino acid metabolism with ACT domain